MSRDQSWRLGRTITVIALIMWIINQVADFFPLSVAIVFVAAAGFALLWRGSTE